MNKPLFFIGHNGEKIYLGDTVLYTDNPSCKPCIVVEIGFSLVYTENGCGDPEYFKLIEKTSKNRDILISALGTISPALKTELDYYINDVEHEPGFDNGRDYDLSDAFEDAATAIEQEHKGGDKVALWNEVKAIYVAVGYVIEVDVSKVHVSRGKKYWFRYENKNMDCVNSWESWIND